MELGTGVRMIKRIAQKKLLQLAEKFPVVTVTGPRQSGKSTLVKMTFQNYDYVSLENPDVLEIVMNDPLGFLNQYTSGIIIDEVQKFPHLLSYIQGIVDEKNTSGMYILTGSNQFEFMKSISQSLAGRTGLINLLPLSYNELFGDSLEPINKILLNGFYPRIYDKDIPPQDFYRAYIETYIERDVKLIINIKNSNLFRKFLMLCAGQIGQILNKESLANSIGVSSHTIEEWLTVLEAGYVVYRLPAYFKNLKKRIVKSPKLYFYDVGVVSYLLNIQEERQFFFHHLKGNIFENMIINEFLKNLYNAGLRSNLYYFRDSNGNEIDLIIDTAFGPVPLEIKSSETYNERFIKGLKYFSGLSQNYKNGGLLLGNNSYYNYKNYKISGYNNIPKIYNSLISEENFDLRKLIKQPSE